MPSKKDLSLQIEDLNNMMTLVETYEEIAATRIRKIRSSVVQTRSFIQELSGIYHELIASHRQEVERLRKKKKHEGKETDLMLARNGKTLCLLLAANSALFGDIINKTFNLFEQEIKKGNVDIAVVGRLGATMFRQADPNIPFAYFDYPDNGADAKALGKITALIVQYEHVYVFHGQFQTIVDQEPVIANLYGLEEKTDSTQKEETKYFFEPSLEKILQFFEAEIFASIFEQTIHEGQLSKNASRMLLLDSATQNIQDTLKKTQLRMRILNHREANSKQLNALTGISLWEK